MSESKVQKFWDLLEEKETAPQKSTDNRYQPSSRATTFWNILDENARNRKQHSMGSISSDNTSYQQRVWLKKYQGNSVDELTKIAMGMNDGDEKDFVSALAAQMDYDNKAGFDVKTGRQEIEALEKQLADLRLQHAAASIGPRANRDNGAAQYAEQIAQLEQEITRRKQYANQSQYIQKGKKLKGVAGNADFGANSGYVSTVDENAG